MATSTRHSPSKHREIDDAELVRIVLRGALLGVPLAYGVSLLVALPGAGWPIAPLIALMPALFAGPWLGSTIMLVTRRTSTDAYDDAVEPSEDQRVEPQTHVVPGLWRAA